MTAKEQNNFILGSPLGEGPTAGTSEALETLIYGMKAGDVSKTPIMVSDNWYIVGVNKREEANSADFATQRSSLMEQMASRKRSAVYGDYLTATKLEMEANGSIKVYKEVMEKVDAPVPGAPPPGMPQGLPQGLIPQPVG
jgi:hypothetical protein